MGTKNEPKQVLSTSDEAASIQTVTGWVSCTGRFWGNDERMARYDGSTHGVCGCGAVVEKNYIRCNPCRAVAERERYLALTKQEWDGSTPLYSNSHDRYFMGLEDLVDMLDEDEYCTTVDDLRLIICKPNYARQIESDHWCDDLPEDGDLPSEMQDSMEAFNEVIRRQPPLSWSPGKFAATSESVIKLLPAMPV
jgi:hypothetical protein